ncbi:GMC family oxidoreductase N-terminal domain-containing protein [uncultured Desulfosarcina sp.]|uniref:GMC family oxidoreductase N-terminal domain-containing protein n=1 Tax=uncultured Desulfosarcina sp. TaxID=218289 RepID=UPI0029C5FC74|nr:GMC family oxidoreductase N-terminal domain-containing protein [uncultured Desulfosarcina sp.]
MPQPAYDAIVIGTGPGGATVAREMSRRNKNVLMLERGPDHPIRGDLRQYIKEHCVPGKSLLFTEQGLAMVRAITVGGSSLYYYATAFPVPFGMLERRGIDIRDEVAEARRELPIAPLKEEMITPATGRIMEAARDLGYPWNPLDKIMYQDRWKPEFSFGYYGDPHGVKWSSRMFVREAQRNGAVLAVRARVERVIVEKGAAVGVEYRQNGALKKAFADRVVVSAGGIGSPAILRKSGIRGVGRDFFFDPLISVCGECADGPIKQGNEIPMSTGCHMEEEGYVMTDMAVPDLLDNLFAAEVLRINGLFRSSRTLRIMIKARDGLGGRVTAGEGIRKKLSAADRKKLLHGAERAKGILKRAGARNIYRTGYLAAHPGGTVRIGEHLDARLSTRIDRLHVCDCSVIPEPWGLPPTLTLVGLGKHLARVLCGEKN